MKINWLMEKATDEEKERLRQARVATATREVSLMLTGRMETIKNPRALDTAKRRARRRARRKTQQQQRKRAK